MKNVVYRNVLIEATRLGYTKSQLAEFLGIARPTLRDRLNGKYPFTSDELIKLKELTGKSIDYLIEEYREGGQVIT